MRKAKHCSTKGFTGAPPLSSTRLPSFSFGAFACVCVSAREKMCSHPCVLYSFYLCTNNYYILHERINRQWPLHFTYRTRDPSGRAMRSVLSFHKVAFGCSTRELLPSSMDSASFLSIIRWPSIRDASKAMCGKASAIQSAEECAAISPESTTPIN